MTDIKDKQEEIAAYAASPLGDTRTVEEIAVGQFARQGDVYLLRVESVPAGAKPCADRQLAPGTTQGSRHTVTDEVDVYRPQGFGTVERLGTRENVAARSVGHVLESKERFTVSHPEHADISLPAGTYQVYHQVDCRTLERVRD